MDDLFDDAPGGRVNDVRLADALAERYLSYALSTIVSRSLPDVRDGLKPVHRRLLYAMRQLRLRPEAGFKKAARVVGDVIGQYHPHGDQAVYDALVRLAQDFAERYPLVEGQGNFGNIDGDNAAAMRYTEARLTPVAMTLLAGLDEDAADFRPTYDGEGREPVVLPGAFPNLLANGAHGIAVGMATNIPPHNAGEVLAAARHLIAHPEADARELTRFVPGPDLPTGGALVESRETVAAAYAAGRGSLRVRGQWTTETFKGGTYQVVITEVPYQVPKARLVERIADLIANRKLPAAHDVRDESADTVRIVLEPRSRNVEARVLMESVFKQTELETRIGLNMNVLDAHTTPRVMDLREVIQAFLDHQHEVLVRRTRHRLGEIARRVEVLDGYLTAYINLDEVIRIIREADAPRDELMRRFELTQVQADAILNMRLRALHRLEETKIREERARLLDEQAELNALMADAGKRWARIDAKLGEVAGAFGADTELGARRTEIADPPEPVEMPSEAVVPREPITVVCTEKGWVRALKGHVADVRESKVKEGDRHRFALHAHTTDKLLIAVTTGRVYTLSADRLPGGRGYGEPLRLLLDLPDGADVAAIVVYSGGRKLVLASDDGRGFLVDEDSLVAHTKGGKAAMTPADGAQVSVCRPVPAAADHLALAGGDRRMLVVPMTEIPERAKGRGPLLMRPGEAGLSDARGFAWADGLSWPYGSGKTRTEPDMSPWLAKRGQRGKAAPKGFPKSASFDG